MQGERFVQLLEQQSLDALLSKVATAHPAVTLSILLEGLHSYLRQVLQHLQDTPGLTLAPGERTRQVEVEMCLTQIRLQRTLKNSRIEVPAFDGADDQPC